MDLDILASMGGFFALRTGSPPAGPQPLAQLYDQDEGPLRWRVESVAERSRTAETRVAASLTHLGLASRLWSVSLASVAWYGRLPDLTADRLRWDPAQPAPDDLWLPGPVARPRPADPAAELYHLIHEHHLEPFSSALRRVARVSGALLRGNSASALAGALRQFDAWCDTAGQARAAERARRIAASLLRDTALRGTGTLTGVSFRRHSCCLYYRTPAGGICGDCVFPAPPGL